MPQSNRKKLLAQLLRLDFYSKLYDRANTDLREVNTEIKLLTKNYQVNSLDKHQEQLASYKQDLDNITKQIADSAEDLKELHALKEQEITKLFKLDDYQLPDCSLEELENQQAGFQQKLNVTQGEIDNYISLEEIANAIQEEQEAYNNEVLEYNNQRAHLQSAIKFCRSQLKNSYQIPYSVDQLEELKHTIENRASPEFIKKEVIFLTDIQKKLELFEDDEDINYISKQIKIRLTDLERNIQQGNNDSSKITMGHIMKYLHQHELNQEIKAENTEHNQELCKLKQQLSRLEIPDKEGVQELQTHYQTLKQLITRQERLTIDLNKFSDQIVLLKKYQQQLSHNKQINRQIKVIDAKINGCLMKNNRLQSNFAGLTSDISVKRQKISDIQQALQKITVLEKRKGVLHCYVASVSKNGVPFLQLKETIPYLEQKVNEMLSLQTDFTVEFRMEDKNIDLILTRNRQEINMQMASGFEKFICSIAIRVAMMNISLLPKSNFIAIDEGFGALDSENLAGTSNLFDYLKRDFDIVLVISHIDLLKNDIECIITPDDLKLTSPALPSIRRNIDVSQPPELDDSPKLSIKQPLKKEKLSSTSQIKKLTSISVKPKIKTTKKRQVINMT